MTVKTKITFCGILFGIGIINFVVFWVVAVYLGGDAVNGKIEGNHFFLMSHGHYTEVSEAAFRYSKWHVYSIWVTHPIAMISAFLANRYKKQNS